MDGLVFFIGLLALIPASLTDLRTREVPDLLSYGFLLFSIGYATLQGILQSSWHPFLSMLVGVVTMFALGSLLFYAGQWGGADAKLLMGVGALLGLWFGNYDALWFLFFLLFAGAAYGLCYTAYLAFRNWVIFYPSLKKFIRTPKIHRFRIIVIILCFLLLLLLFVPSLQKELVILLAFALYVLFYAWVVVKTVEQSVLIKEYPIARLTEGDWIYKDVMVKEKRICGPKDLGISKEQIATLRRLNVKKVWVKEGIPFVPSFLVAWVLLWFLQVSLAHLLQML